jgi:two-component system, sensor histidine kinase
MPPRATLLNVDDSEPKRYLKTRILEHAGFGVIEAASVADAKALLHERRFDLVLLDVRLPDGNGRDLCAWIKSSPESAQTVVLQTSACAIDPMDRVAALDAGADGYLVEPMEPEELVAHVTALLRMRQAETDRQAALVALREADRRKDEFLAMLAHELRNPLAPIRNAAEILAQDDERLRERARGIVKRQVEHLARLVDDLLEVSRITQRKIVLRRSLVTLGSILDAAVETARPYIDARAQELQIDAPPRDFRLHVDAVRLAQALGNLLHNASKFSGRGAVIRLEGRVTGDAVVLAVRDDGMGITSEMLTSVFDLFVQDERSLERSQGGLGIGLSLVRSMAEMHGGRVEANSAGRDQGSCFTIQLPLAGNVARDGAAARVGMPASTRPRRILIVEDNADAAETLRILLEAGGHEVTVAHSAWQALEAARCFSPEVALLDIGLPGMDGYELAGRLRRLPETEFAYLIAVSGYGQERDRARAAAAGFDVHLTKPVEPQRLEEAIGGSHAGVTRDETTVLRAG